MEEGELWSKVFRGGSDFFGDPSGGIVCLLERDSDCAAWGSGASGPASSGFRVSVGSVNSRINASASTSTTSVAFAFINWRNCAITLSLASALVVIVEIGRAHV